MKHLLVTHSSRRFQEERASLNFLEKRFASPDRLERKPDVESFSGVDAAAPFEGALSVWSWDEEAGELAPLGVYRPGYKVQFAEVVGENVLVLGSDRLEVLDGSLNAVRVIRHPHLVGAHTVFNASGGRVWVTSAPGNAALLVDIGSGGILREQVMPERYGQGYPLTSDTNLAAHYIPTDHQPTHVNCAFPCDAGLLVTLWIPGVVGLFGHDGEYREIVSGFRGCHGGRIAADGSLYFSDSAAGIVWFVDSSTGAVQGRFQPGSRWVHDCAQVTDDVYACTLSDDNELLLFSRETQEPVARVGLDMFGASAMFVNAVEVGPGTARLLAGSPQMEQVHLESPASAGPDAVPPVTDSRFWTWYDAPCPGITARYERKSGALALSTDRELRLEVLIRSSRITLQPGTYRLLFGATCDQGQMEAGIEVGDKLLSSVCVGRVHGHGSADFLVSETTECFLVVAAANSGVASIVEAAVKYVTIQVIEAKVAVAVAPRKSAYLKDIFSPGKAY